MEAKDFFLKKSMIERVNLVHKIAKKLIQLQEEGCIILDENGSVIEGKVGIRTDFNDDSWDLMYVESGRCKESVIQIGYYHDGRPSVPTKASIMKTIGKFSVIKLSDRKGILSFI